MIATPLRLLVLFLVPVLIAAATASHQRSGDREQAETESKRVGRQHAEEKTLQLQYLEVVTPSVNETCDALAKAHGVTFSEPIAELGNARTAQLNDGGRIGVRAPMGEEQPVVRPYFLVDDIHAAVRAAEAAGAEVLMPPTEAPGLCTFAIYYMGKVEHGFWRPMSETAPSPHR